MAERVIHIKMYDGIYRIIAPGYAKVSGMADGTLVGLGKPMIDVVIGDDRAAVIDTGYGDFDLRGYIEKNITDKPLVCLNTHGHLDHVGGNVQFDEVWINEKDLEAAKNADMILEGRKCAEVLACGEVKYSLLQGGEVIDLGGRNLRAIPIPGHSEGSTGFIDSKTKVLFSGDAVLKRIIVNGRNRQYVKNVFTELKKENFVEVLGGHWIWPLGRDQIDKFIDLIDGASKDELTVLTNNFGDRIVNSYMCCKGKDFYDPEFCAISFGDPEIFFGE